MRSLQAAAVLIFLIGCTKTTMPEGTGGGSGRVDPEISFVDRTSGVPDPASISEAEVTVQRQFTCDPGAIAAVEPLVGVSGADGEDIVITPTKTPCAFDLHYRVDEARSPLSGAPMGYLLAAARKMPDGVRVVCASEIVHHAVPEPAGRREMDGVQIRCWASATTSFAVSALAVEGGEDWAAWVRDVEPDPAGSGAYLLTWVRDFSYQFFNLADRGRPATDGVFQTRLSWDGVALTVGPATRVGDKVNPFIGVPTNPWAPSADDVSKLGGFIDFDGVVP